MDHATSQNAAAYFISYVSGKVESFATVAERDAALEEIATDDAAWQSA